MRNSSPGKPELESQLESFFYNQVRRMGGMVEKITPVRWGLPDRLVLLPGGRIFLVELKTETGRVRAAQSVWHRKAAQRGTHVVVLRGRRQTEAWLRKQAETIQREGLA